MDEQRAIAHVLAGRQIELNRRVRSGVALNDVSLELHAGEFFPIVGIGLRQIDLLRRISGLIPA